ncbi:hypothetical protein JKF63_03863 [Porcisia hertigi]|uniref:Uncharacterized protein n=1 Tax=Porcisia hertigi TaxID=2761500 RepID=A0A836IC70_9TRYP|nr:hypothetical protein JKF63_03863 [Porcisia hertigi]
MLSHLDASTGDALRSFQDALNQAQQSLQRDEKRLSATTQLLSDLTIEVDALKAHNAPNSATRQRREALLAEKIKMSHQTRHQREAIAAMAAHISHLKSPGAKLTEQVSALKGDVRALRRQYGQRAAQVHAYITSFLQPHNSLENLRCQISLLQQERVSQAEALRTATQRLEERKADLAALVASVRMDATSCPTVNSSGPPEPRPSQTNANPDTAALSTLHTDPRGEQLYAEEEVCTLIIPTATEEDRLAEAMRQRSAQLDAHKSVETQHDAERTTLEALRVDLKQQVLLLCQEIEQADAAQQRDQKVYLDTLNDAASGSVKGVPPQCRRCSRDLYRGFS